MADFRKFTDEEIVAVGDDPEDDPHKLASKVMEDPDAMLHRLHSMYDTAVSKRVAPAMFLGMVIGLTAAREREVGDA